MSGGASPDPLWLDRALADPLEDQGPLGFRTAVRLDEREEFPTEAARTLDERGISRHFVPSRLGGELDSFEELACLVRAIARRDVTLAVGQGQTCLGTQPVFLAGDAALQRSVAARVLARESFALALTERRNGSDVLASTTFAEGKSPSFVTGEKWLINNATRASGVSVFARTRPAGGPRGFSLLLVDKDETRGDYEVLPKIRTHGIRGADIGGIRFSRAACPSDPIGGEGAGLAVLLKTFAVTRTLIPSIAVGAADSALRIVLDFAKSRELYGGTVLQIPHARAVLSDAMADQLAWEAASLAGARVLHTAPEQASFWASVLKYHVPTSVERVVRELAVVLGARHYLREDHAFGMFQKIQRDAAILAVFDGNTLVNLQNVALHAHALGRGSDTNAGVGSATDLLGPLPDFDPRALSIAARAVCGAEVLASDALERIEGRALARILRPLLEQLRELAIRTREQMAQATLRNAFDMTPQVVGLASRYAQLSSAALAASVYARWMHRPSGPAATGEWLVLVLAREVGDDGIPPTTLDMCREALLRFMVEARACGEPFSLLAQTPNN